MLNAGPHDRVARGKTVVVEAGESLEQVMALDGDVVLRRGARVKSAVAVNGNLILEDGAKVTGTAAAFGGQIGVAPGAQDLREPPAARQGTPAEGRERQGHRPGALHRGRDLSTLLVSKLVEKARRCRIETGSSEIQL